MLKILFISLLLFSSVINALEYSKIDFEGCPENAFCKKETGLTRKRWLEQLKKFSKGEITEQKMNAFIQSEYGTPISGWAREEASLQPNILMWDSPCKQHKSSSNKYYIADVFRKNLSASELKETSTYFFSQALFLDNNKITASFIIPRGDPPLFIKDGNLYFLREEEGIFYGLFISQSGLVKMTKNQFNTLPLKESTCPKEAINQFLREAPGANFYQSQNCKEVWDATNKRYQTILLGWSCN